MTSVCVVSDLHMFCRRSEWNHYLEQLDRAAADADLFVFNGDTFDFKWTTLESIDHTVEQAVEFLRSFSYRHAPCQVHVNLGNHDHVQKFMDALDRLSRELGNLSWHPYYLRVGSTLFLHGDVANRKMNHRDLERYRASWLHHKKQGRIRNQIYDVAFGAKAHVAISRLAFPHKRTLRRVAAYLDDIGHSAGDGVSRVFFGHTHVPVSGATYNGVTYHNGGAPMKGMKFSLLKAKI
ncbi:MAG: metallophosphoesterase [Candidatus Hydrogenedentes bacterium]|nr:metallophosphoesterase [Candidatus Hydrogenedentota bacterium]